MLERVFNNDKNIPANKMGEIMQFVTTFGKTENVFSNDMMKPGGKRIISDANEYTRRVKIKSKWRTNANENKIKKVTYKGKPIYDTKTGQYNPEAFKSVVITTNPNSYFDFLELLGIKFTDKQRVLALGNSKYLNDKSQYILKGIIEGRVKFDITDVTEEMTEAYKDLNTMIDMEYASDLDNNEMSSMGLDGETRFNHSLNSYISNIMDNINKFDTREELFKFYPHLNADEVDYLNHSLMFKVDGILFGDTIITTDRKGNEISRKTLKRPENKKIVLHTADGVPEVFSK